MRTLCAFLVLLTTAQAVRREVDPEDRPLPPSKKPTVPEAAAWVPIVYVFVYAAFVVIIQSVWPLIRDKAHPTSLSSPDSFSSIGNSRRNFNQEGSNLRSKEGSGGAQQPG